MIIASPQLGLYSSIDDQITGEGMKNRNLLWIIPIKLSWTEKTASNVVRKAMIIMFVFGKGRKRPQLGLI